MFFTTSAMASESGIRAKTIDIELKKNTEHVHKTPFFMDVFAMSEVSGVQVRFFATGKWQPWQTLRLEEGEWDGSELLYIPKTDLFMLRSDHDVKITVTLLSFVNPPLQIAASQEIVLDTGFPPEIRAIMKEFPTIKIFSRKDWGADENLLIEPPEQPQIVSANGENHDERDKINLCEPIENAFPEDFQIQEKKVETDDSGNQLWWPKTYSKKVEKIVIHHTAQTIKDLNNDSIINETDYALSVRAVYVYHTVSRRWGDLGYHYLVDPAGNIYEGRSGGKNVIAAHVLCQNSNTIGIAVMGNYEKTEVPEKAFEGLVNAVTYLSEQYDIDPTGETEFRGKKIPNIVTHAEVGEITKSLIGLGGTQCPGMYLKDKMAMIRRYVAEGGIKPPLAFFLGNVQQLLRLKPLEKLTYFLSLKNTGQQTWTKVSISNGKKNISATLVSSATASGQSMSIPLSIEAPFEGSRKQEKLKISLNDFQMPKTIRMILSVDRPVFSYDLKTLDVGKTPLLVGEKRTVRLVLQNTGNFPWRPDGPYRVEILPVEKRGRVLKIPQKSFSTSLLKEIALGKTAEISINLPVQRLAGDFRLELLPVMAREKGFRGDRIIVKLPVEPLKFQAHLEVSKKSARVRKGSEQPVDLLVFNDGNIEWEPGMVEVKFGKTTILIEELVKPKKSAMITISVKAGYDDKKVMINGVVRLNRLPSSVEEKRFVSQKRQVSLELRAYGFALRSDARPAKGGRSGRAPAKRKQWIEVGQPTAGQAVRVLLSKVHPKTIQIMSPEDFEVSDENSVRTLKGGEVWTIKKDDLQTIYRIRTKPSSFLEIINAGREKKFGSVMYADNRFRGVLEIRLLDGQIAVINELPLEDYMKGIGEVPESDEHEKRKAIAVLARSYALHYLVSGFEKFSGKPYNASDDPAVFQKYLGYGFEERSPKWQQALKETEREVLVVDPELDPKATREERILRAAYFSCTDGRTTKTPEEAGWTQDYFKRFGAVFASVDDPLGDDPLRQGKVQCGHQVGLSGYGATQMAKQGKNYREIIDYYYQRVKVDRWR